MLKKLFGDANYIALDRISYAEEAEVNPTNFLNRFKDRVIIDEIQYAPSLLRHLKIKVDEERNLNGKWILTGSQQFVLMKHARESLAGRIRILHLNPLSANELINASLLTNRRDLLWKGGFPEIWAKNLNANDFFNDYIQTYLERDLKEILNVSNLRDFRRFLSLLALRTGQILNYSEISKEVGVAVNTIKAWVSALEISGLILLLPPYYSNLGKRLIKAPKVYFCDNGLAAALLNITSPEALKNTILVGNLWENFVFTEFLNEGFIPGRNIFFFRDQNGGEIDFIVEKDGNIFLVEAKHNEHPNPGKLNFQKIAPLFTQKPTSLLACTIEENEPLVLENYIVYNPLYGHPDLF